MMSSASGDDKKDIEKTFKSSRTHDEKCSILCENALSHPEEMYEVLMRSNCLRFSSDDLVVKKYNIGDAVSIWRGDRAFLRSDEEYIWDRHNPDNFMRRFFYIFELSFENHLKNNISKLLKRCGFGSLNKENNFINVYKLPLDNMISTDVIGALINIADATKHRKKKLFDNKVIQAAIDGAWDDYGRMNHFLLTFLYLTLLILIFITNYYFKYWSPIKQSESPTMSQTFLDWSANQMSYANSTTTSFQDWCSSQAVANFSFKEWTLKQMVQSNDSSFDYRKYFEVVKTKPTRILPLTILISSVFLLIEIFQIYREKLSYFSNLQNFVDILAHSLSICGGILRMRKMKETESSAGIMAACTILLGVRLIYFLRPFTATGYFVHMVFAICIAIRPVVYLLIILIFFFSQAFLLISVEPQLFNDPSGGVIQAFLLIIGQGPDFENIVGFQSFELAALAQFGLCVYIFLSGIVLFNILIALMNSIYADIKDNQESEFYMQRARIMKDQRPYGPWWRFLFQRPSFQPNSAVSDVSENSSHDGKVEQQSLGFKKAPYQKQCWMMISALDIYKFVHDEKCEDNYEAPVLSNEEK